MGEDGRTTALDAAAPPVSRDEALNVPSTHPPNRVRTDPRESELMVETSARGIPGIDPDAPVRRRGAERPWDVTAAVTGGGILGAEARYGLSIAVPHAADQFPWSTVYVNVIGCFCLGLLMAVLGMLASPHRLVRPFIGIGVIGGFTTFSTFAVDAERLLHQQRPGTALLYVLCTLLASAAALAAATIGSQLAGRQLLAARIQRVERAQSQRHPNESDVSMKGDTHA